MSTPPEMPIPDTPRVLLEHHLKALRLPTVLREYDKVARQSAEEKADFPTYLLRLTELELLDRDRRCPTRRMSRGVSGGQESGRLRFPRCSSPAKTWCWTWPAASSWIEKKIFCFWATAFPAETASLALGLVACQRGHRVRFTTAAALVSELIEARDEKHLLRLQKQLAAYELLIVDELGFVPLSKTGAELLFEIFSQRYERASVPITSNRR